jgi:hypothetical protein
LPLLQAKARGLLLASAPSRADNFFDEFVPSSSAASELMEAEDDSSWEGTAPGTAAATAAATGFDADDEGEELDDDDDDDDEAAAGGGGGGFRRLREARETVDFHPWAPRAWRVQHVKVGEWDGDPVLYGCLCVTQRVCV